jgi:hypothetical protein
MNPKLGAMLAAFSFIVLATTLTSCHTPGIASRSLTPLDDPGFPKLPANRSTQ